MEAIEEEKASWMRNGKVVTIIAVTILIGLFVWYLHSDFKIDISHNHWDSSSAIAYTPDGKQVALPPQK